MKPHFRSVGGRALGRLIQGIVLPAILAMLPTLAFAAMEEVVVTAQRVEEKSQDVPIAVTALTGNMLEERQVIDPSDLQMNAPNVSFTATNFGSSSFSIRGIGRLLTAGSGDSGVSTHVNQIPVGTNLTAVEFYDTERVEILRGPQGTLFGRNATGGAINYVTRMPDFDTRGGFVDMEYGSYQDKRIKGAFNFGVRDNLAFRFAGMKLKRDGYTKNKANHQVGLDGKLLDGIDKDLDGRDFYTYRFTGRWQPTDHTNIWFMKSKFHEDDDKARITNQVCATNPLPTTGCLPDAYGWQQPNVGASTGGIIAGAFGVIPFGDPGGGAPGSTLVYNYPRPTGLNFREQHTDFEPVFRNREDLWAGGADYDFEAFTLSVLGAKQDTEYLSRQDYNMDVGYNLPPTVYNPGGMWPGSETPGYSPNAGFKSNNPCNYFAGTVGVFGGCVNFQDQTRAFLFDQSDSKGDYYTVEGKVTTHLDGPVNFLFGGSKYHTEGQGDYYVNGNILDINGIWGTNSVYPTMFNVPSDPGGGSDGEGWATFGEAYYQANDNIKVTLGFRYNRDEKNTSSTSAFYNASNVSTAGPFGIGATPVWSRIPGFVTSNAGDPISAGDQSLLDYYGVPTAQVTAAAGTAANSAQRLAVNDMIPIIPGFNETRDLTNSPDHFEFDKVTGRIGVDWQWRDNSMAYAFFSKGYKPGGFNPPINPAFQATSSFSFKSETVDAFELGSKNVAFNGQAVLNVSAFHYDYKNLQVARIANNSSLNDNIDAHIMGLEFESSARPDFVPNMNVDFSYAWLRTRVNNSQSVDPVNRTASDPTWVLLNNIDPGSTTGVNYVAVASQVQAAAPGAITAGAALNIPGTIDPTFNVPVYFSRGYLDFVGVTTSDGLDTDIDGNDLPNSPRHNIKVGADYTWDVDRLAGGLTLRIDYYWQSKSYAREFNTKGDEIDAWDQINLSLTYRSHDGRWQARGWVRNLTNEDNVTGKYLTSDTSGFYRNYFLTEPRIYGLTVRFGYERNRS